MKSLIISLQLKTSEISRGILNAISFRSSVYLLAVMLSTIVVTSCTDTSQDNFESEKLSIKTNSKVYENKLTELTVFFGEVMKDRSALEELYSFAEVGESYGDINYSLKDLFEGGVAPTSKKESAIVSAFRNTAANMRTTENAIDADELIQFIIDNDISVLAPYLVEDFNINEIDELTVSWWTQDFEAENFALDENWKGSTKAVLIPLGESSGIGQALKDALEGEYFLANDEWALENPTLVLGAFEDDSDIELLNVQNVIQNPNTNARTASGPVTLCNATNKTTQNLTVRMPAFRLDENIRAWPNPNRIYLWVAHGDFAFGTNGLPTVSPNVNAPFANFEVTRREASIKRWKVTPASFILSSWNPDSDNMHIVWGCTKTDLDIDVDGTIKASQSGVSGSLTVKVALRESVELESSLSFDKCFTIRNNVNSLNQGFGFYGNTNYPVYAFNRIRAYFTIESF